MMKGNRWMTVLLALLLALSARAQTDRREVRAGNRDYAKERWREAELDYRRALVKDSLSVAARYNLASTLYRLGEYDEAARQLSSLDKYEGPDAASVRYNEGNVAVARKDWQGAVDAYRKALLLHPEDRDAKENYVYAKKMLERQQQQQQQQQNQDQNQNQNQDQNKDQQQNQDQNQDQNKDQNQDQNKDQDQNQNQDRNQDGGQQPREGQMTPQQARQMLQAIEAKEKETQDKVKKEKAAALRSRQKEKNW